MTPLQIGRRELLAWCGATLAPACSGTCARPRAEGGSASPRAAADAGDAGDALALFLCGDVMLGRGIDQILPHPGSAELRESHMQSAKGYVELAESVNGKIPRAVSFDYPWGDALGVLDGRAPDYRIVNLETSITTASDWAPKGINYRMHPKNVGVLSAARIDCCVLANNHVLDFGERGLEETLSTLERAGLAVAGAGRDRERAAAPAVLRKGGARRVLVVAFGASSAGVPPAWAATQSRPGVQVLEPELEGAVRQVEASLEGARQPGDVVVASLHWGGNFGYAIPAWHRRLAHALVDRVGVHVVYGHSSHHPLGIEVHHGRPILYGAGDLLNDYEGISGYEEYRGELGLMYFVRFAGERLARLHMAPMRIRRFRLERASEPDAKWLASTLDGECRPLGARVERGPDGDLELRFG